MTDTGRMYGTVDAARMAGVSVRQLAHWAARGYLRPVRVPGLGQGGKQLQWDERDIDAAAKFGALSAALGGGGGLLWTFAQALTVPRGIDEAVGVIVEVGQFVVTIEVQRA
jgi:hypothetical protein